MLLLPKFQSPTYRQYHVLPTLNNSVIPNNQKRNFHFSTKKKDNPKYKGVKIENTNYQNEKLKSKDSVKYFQKLENSLKNTMDTLKPTDISVDSLKTYWPNQKEEFHKFQKRHPFEFDDEVREKPFEDLNIEDGKQFGKALSYLSVEEAFPQKHKVENRFPISETLNIGRHAQVTAGGRVFSYSALVMLGTGRGTGGLGYARGNTVPEAIAEAKRKAEKNMISLDLWRGYHIGNDIRVKCNKSYMFMNAQSPGYGRRPTAWDMDIILDAFGLNDISIGWGGRNNKYSIYRAIFEGLLTKTRSPEKVARMLGMKLFSRAGAFYHTYD